MGQVPAERHRASGDGIRRTSTRTGRVPHEDPALRVARRQMHPPGQGCGEKDHVGFELGEREHGSRNGCSLSLLRLFAWQHRRPVLAPGSRGRSDSIRRSGLRGWNGAMSKMPHDHICAECGAIYPCPAPEQCPCKTAEERIGLCPQCEPKEGVEMPNRSEDGFEAILRPGPGRTRVQ